jgi:DNA (cytosine-5)-methyltransferase 1
MTAHVSYQTIGTNRTKARLWIEGHKLAAAGFVKGATYTLRGEGDVLELFLDPEGDRKVSGKTTATGDKPIVDIVLGPKNADLPSGTRVRVLFREGRVSVRVHHEETARVVREARFKAHMAAGTLREASMFTGGGVSTHAIHTALRDYGHNAHLAWVVDADASYLDAAARSGHSVTDTTSMLVGRAEEIERQFFQPVDILSFSMPCSTFSKAGKAKHGQAPEDHEGATALFGTMTAIRASNPAVLISENVVEAKDSPAYTLMKAELARLGYTVHERVMDSADTGTLENRKRYWFVALSNGIAAGFDFTLIHVGARSTPQRIADLLETGIPDKAWFDASYFDAKAEVDAAAGKGFKRQVLSGEETRCGTIGRFYAKRRSTEPFLQGPDGRQRLFTPREHARMKSVPEALVEGINPTRAHEILGQSVDWRQAYIAMGAVLAHLTGVVGGNLARP